MANILVIDDDPLMRQTVSAMLSTAGHVPMSAQDGMEGLRMLERDACALVITDILMPGQEGIETIRAIRRKDQRIGIIAISGGSRNGNLDYLQLATEFGADATLAKPFTSKALLEKVDAVLAACQQRIVAPI